jgi:2Fe-2S ferredoxin
MPKVRFLPSDLCVEAQPGQTIFELGWKQDTALQSACVGKGTCGLCRVVIRSGEDQLSPYNEVEDKHLGNLYHLTKIRLSCQCTIVDRGDAAEEIVVEIKPKRKPKSSDR